MKQTSEFAWLASLQNPKVKYVAALRSRTQRQKEGVFLAEGIRVLELAAESNYIPRLCFLSTDLDENERALQVVAKLQAKGAHIYRLPPEVYKKASGTQSPQGLLAVFARKPCTLQNLQLNLKSTSWLVILDGVQDPGNAGSILRTAEAAGAEAILSLQGSADLFSEKAVRASAGAVFLLPVCTGIAREACQDFLAAQKIIAYLPMLDAFAKPYDTPDYRKSCAFVFGNEGNGLRASFSQGVNIHIPMRGKSESLNVAAAASVLCFEVCRQRASGK